MVGAVTLALEHEMARDTRVVLFGEDVEMGGVFRATSGLREKFGERVFDTPLAESAIAGMALGAAAQGLRPVAEIQFAGFIYPCVDQIANHIARLQWRTLGRLKAPLVIRTIIGAGIGAPEHHSESPEAIFAHIPGLTIFIPTSPERAYRGLLAAIRNPDPVLFFEPTRLYQTKESFEDNGEALQLHQPFLLREGGDLTMVAWSAIVKETCLAADNLSAEFGISADVFDLATVAPLSIEPILESVQKTGRLMVITEAVRTCSIADAIVSRVACDPKTLMCLEKPPIVIAAPHVPTSMSRHEHFFIPSVKEISTKAQALFE